MKKTKYLKTAIVIGTQEQLKEIYIMDLPTGAIVRVLNKKHVSLENLGKIVEIEYKWKGLNYLIPEKYIL